MLNDDNLWGREIANKLEALLFFIFIQFFSSFNFLLVFNAAQLSQE